MQWSDMSIFSPVCNVVCFVEKLLSRTNNGKDMKILKVTAVRSGVYVMVRHNYY